MSSPQITRSLTKAPLLERGSEWRKWDLHVHSPLSVLNNQFKSNDSGPDWDAYIRALKQLKDISAVGITDYFLIDGYKEVRAAHQRGLLPNIKLILPNIEFRLDILVPTTKSGNTKKINLHVIFSDQVDPDDIEEHFLRELKFCYEGVPQDQDEERSITKSQLEDLGKKLKAEQETFRGKSDLFVGCMNATVNLQRIKDTLTKRPTKFKDKYLIVLAEENTNIISWDGQGHNARKVLVSSSDAVFSSNVDVREWALGKKHPSVEEFRSEFQTLKPCIHGSDAHELETIGKPDNNRFCWIKADLSFEGLRQILFEPDERVFIGDTPLNLKNDYQVTHAYDRMKTKEFFAALRQTFDRDQDGKVVNVGLQLKKDKTEEHFNNWFYSIDPFSVTYSIQFEDRDLQLLSPGQKGIVLLLVYLEVDQADQRPLIIDQPEDNLDNLSVYSNLIAYFRKRKKSRQVIMITHNPNLVVNTDAEQIIVANFDGARKPRIVYTSGSLETTAPITGIREQVCAILEGGTEAFLKREQKYSIQEP